MIRKDGMYFEYEHSIHSSGVDIRGVLRSMANRYMADHMQKQLKMRAFSRDSFSQDFSAVFQIDFNNKFPDAEYGDYAYAFSYVYSRRDYKALMQFRTKSPAWVYLNGELIFETGVVDEGSSQKKVENVSFKKGKNTFFIKCRKNLLGFGCEFGDGYVRGNAMNFINPTAEHDGKNGWAYTKPFNEDVFANADSLPPIGVSCTEVWLPSPEIRTGLGIDEVLENKRGVAYALTFIKNNGLKREYPFAGIFPENSKVYIDGVSCFEGQGKIEFTKVLSSGLHEVLVEIKHEDKERWGFSLNTDENFCMEEIVGGMRGSWLYLGILEDECHALTEKFNPLQTYNGVSGTVYWRTDEENTDVRLSLESDLYGRWNYPIGVVLYGLSEAAKELGDANILDYAKGHMNICVDSYRYAEWDSAIYGRAGLDHQLVENDALDYCGSCGNAMLALLDYGDNAKAVADIIADYMENGQERLENGMFYRAKPGTMQENSIWADDLYMSIPFLCRYYRATGNVKYIEDAVRQIECFKEYLFMPQKKIMSHVYKLDYQKKNEIPWGRGNGWVVFALSELLSALPAAHAKRTSLTAFYQELCEGYLALQDASGLWHQVLDEEDAYLESSATAMFVIAFARGLRHGWLSHEKFAKAAFLGWEGLCKYCITATGDLYAVCIGSALSFRRDYYMKELLWNVNDTHGTGIVLLAGSELLRMMEEGR